MGFFDKMKSIAEKANQFLNDNDDDLEEDEIYDTTPPRNSERLFKLSSLNTPPPPPVPQSYESMSVMVAVNGKSYGPYEQATLREMISNGALTTETLVFMDGMNQWQPAGQVPKIMNMFGNQAPAPQAPPIPWTDASRNKVDQNHMMEGGSIDDSTLSPKLNRLITAAIADGEISDMERQVLIRNAQEEGVAMDEFVMVLEARLYEQRKALQAQREQQEMQSKLAQAQITAAMNSNNHKPSSERTGSQIRKCPACGAIITSTFMVKCPECGYELDLANTDRSEVQILLDKLENIESEYQALNPIKQAMGGTAIYMQRKATAISTFILPSSKKGLLDFMTIACATAKTLLWTDPQKKAWKQKASEVVVRAKNMYEDDSEFQSQVRNTAKQFSIKVK